MDGERLLFSRQSAGSPLPRRALWRSGPLARYPPQDTDATQCDMAGGRGGVASLSAPGAWAIEASQGRLQSRGTHRFRRLTCDTHESAAPWRCRRTFLLDCPRQDWKAAIGTLSKRTQRLLHAYIATLLPNLLPSAPIFYTGGLPGPKGGQPRPSAPYTKDTFGDDFRVVRAADSRDKRKIMDFHRWAVRSKGLPAKSPPEVLAAKMVNTIDQNKELQATYLASQVSLVRLADVGRVEGRRRRRGENKSRPEKLKRKKDGRS